MCISIYVLIPPSENRTRPLTPSYSFEERTLTVSCLSSRRVKRPGKSQLVKHGTAMLQSPKEKRSEEKALRPRLDLWLKGSLAFTK